MVLSLLFGSHDHHVAHSVENQNDRAEEDFHINSCGEIVNRHIDIVEDDEETGNDASGLVGGAGRKNQDDYGQNENLE